MQKSTVKVAQLVSLTEAAELLNVSKATLRNWDNSGKLSAHRHPINGYRLFDILELRALQSQLGLFDLQIEIEPLSIELDLRTVRKLIAKLHNIIRDADSQSNIISRFDELTKLLFSKVVSDKDKNLAKVSPFSNSSIELNADELRGFYAELSMQFWELIPPRFGKLECSDRAIIECVRTLRPFDFAESKFDVKGLAYEEIIRNTFDKGDHQQFFTPPHIVDFIVDITKPFIGGDICDPASGTGGFLASVARKISDYRTLTSFEIDERLSWVSGINIKLHNGYGIQTKYLPDGGTLGKAAQQHFNSFDTILTNPPFGSDFTDKEALESMTLGAGKSARRGGILFLERCHSLLRENGLLAIIIDEGVLNLTHAVDVRKFLTSNFDVRAIISLPETAFMPYASVNASILIMQKRSNTGTNTSVFFAKADFVGRKANGDEDVRYSKEGRSYIHSDLPEILKKWYSHLNGGEIENGENVYVADVASNLAVDGDDGHRIDFQYHHPSRWISRDLIASCIYPLRSLAEICMQPSSSVVPAKELADTIIPYTGLANIEPFSGVARQTPTPANSLKSAVKTYRAGDIVFAKMRPNLRKVAYMEFEEGGYVSHECTVLAPKVDDDGEFIINPKLLSVLLRSDFVFGQILHLIAGIGRPRIGGKELMKVQIPIPPIEKQRAILKRYESKHAKAAKLRQDAENLISDAEKLVASSIQDLANEFVRE